MTDDDHRRRLFREGMSRLGAAVNLIATDGPAGRHGFTASAVCSVTDTPPTLLVCMNRSVRSHDAFLSNGRLSVNVLSGPHENLSRVFADHEVAMTDRFSNGTWRDGAHGTPLLDDAVVAFDCRIATHRTIGSHDVVFCDVEDVHLGPEASAALIWWSRSYHRLG